MDGAGNLQGEQKEQEMRKHISGLVLVMVLFFGAGCDPNSVIKKITTGVSTTGEGIQSTESLVEFAEKNIPGYKGLSPSAKDKIIMALMGAQSTAPKLSGIAAFIGTMVPSAAPIANSLESLFLGMGALSGGLIAFVNKRKVKAEEAAHDETKAVSETHKAVALTAMRAGETLDGFGPAITKAKTDDRISDATEALYRENIKPRI